MPETGEESGRDSAAIGVNLDEPFVACDWVYAVGHADGDDVFVLSVSLPEADRTAGTDFTSTISLTGDDLVVWRPGSGVEQRIEQCTDHETVAHGTPDETVSATLALQATFLSYSPDNGCGSEEYLYEAEVALTDVVLSTGAYVDLGPFVSPIGWHHCE